MVYLPMVQLELKVVQDLVEAVEVELEELSNLLVQP